jgi:hypothetical protein
MIKQNYIDLMNQEFDGTNSAEQSRELEEYLSSHQEARDYYRELAQALGVFEKVDLLDPPPGLRENILAHLDQQAGADQKASSKEVRQGLWAACSDWFRLPLRPAYAFTFLAGLTFGLMLFAGSNWLTNRHGTDLYDNVKGTANHSSWDLENVSEGELQLPGIVGLYRTMREGSEFKLHLKLRSTKPAVIKFRHGLHTSLQHYSSNNPVPANLTVSSSLVELNHRGNGSYDLVFHEDMDTQAPITMLVFSEGRLVKTQTLEKQDP